MSSISIITMWISHRRFRNSSKCFDRLPKNFWMIYFCLNMFIFWNSVIFFTLITWWNIPSLIRNLILKIHRWTSYPLITIFIRIIRVVSFLIWVIYWGILSIIFSSSCGNLRNIFLSVFLFDFKVNFINFFLDIIKFFIKSSSFNISNQIFRSLLCFF